MAYLFESRIPEEKSVLFALRYVYGINYSISLLICKNLGFSQNFKVKELSSEQISKLIKITELMELKIGTELKKTKQFRTKNLVAIKSYRGFRKSQGLPARGQRTHTNAKSCRKPSI
jgi:small subunit ribosomal protein S13